LNILLYICPPTSFFHWNVSPAHIELCNLSDKANMSAPGNTIYGFLDFVHFQVFRKLEYEIMDKVQKLSNSECCTQLSGL
jgi:hypothetical protein